ncbi:unnamed protein product [Spirodela intermedia]|uniref:C2H2-type domain-containing protein n=1 Tax=Spirodela intermedia TaxID=51605 RepID=A0A7I8IB22_SPIIN|nr:unnamed protein product [Spirodela intermedia]CAA6654905.1 unnamed protein product [Spirodela intermedia]
MERERKAEMVMFECKTCHRRFSTFQALGGHRTSHRRQPNLPAAWLRPCRKSEKVHECTALGGHMRRHKSAAAAAAEGLTSPPAGSPASLFFRLDLNLPPMEDEAGFLTLGPGK